MYTTQCNIFYQYVSPSQLHWCMLTCRKVVRTTSHHVNMIASMELWRRYLLHTSSRYRLELCQDYQHRCICNVGNLALEWLSIFGGLMDKISGLNVRRWILGRCKCSLRTIAVDARVEYPLYLYHFKVIPMRGTKNCNNWSYIFVNFLKMLSTKSTI